MKRVSRLSANIVDKLKTELTQVLLTNRHFLFAFLLSGISLLPQQLGLLQS